MEAEDHYQLGLQGAAVILAREWFVLDWVLTPEKARLWTSVRIFLSMGMATLMGTQVVLIMALLLDRRLRFVVTFWLWIGYPFIITFSMLTIFNIFNGIGNSKVHGVFLDLLVPWTVWYSIYRFVEKDQRARDRQRDAERQQAETGGDDRLDAQPAENGGVPENGENDIPENGVPENGENDTPENGENDIPENGVQENGENDTPENGENGIPENGENEIPENGVPENGVQEKGIPAKRAPANGAPENDSTEDGVPANGAPVDRLDPTDLYMLAPSHTDPPLNWTPFWENDLEGFRAMARISNGISSALRRLLAGIFSPEFAARLDP